MKLKEEYEKIVATQNESGIIEKVPNSPTGNRVFHTPHKPVIREDAATTKVRVVFNASSKPHYLANSINNCMYRGPPLQPLMWDTLIRARMSTDILLCQWSMSLRSHVRYVRETRAVTCNRTFEVVAC